LRFIAVVKVGKKLRECGGWFWFFVFVALGYDPSVLRTSPPRGELGSLMDLFQD